MNNRPLMLSATFVRNANRPGRYGDGLGLLVRPALRGGVNKSWTQSVRIDGRPTSLGLGRYPVVTLAMARERALENARAIARGHDPRRSGRAVPTFAEALETVIGIHVPHWKDRAGSERQGRASLAMYALPRIGAVMKWAVAQGLRADNPAGDAISAALLRTTPVRRHQRALPHAEVRAALARVRASRR